MCGKEGLRTEGFNDGFLCIFGQNNKCTPFEGSRELLS